MPRIPNRVAGAATEELRGQMLEHGIKPVDGYKVYVTHAKRGRTNCNAKNITVPSWAMFGTPSGDPDPLYRLYYAAHECAHTYATEIDGERGHGATFMYYFKKLCPAHLQHHELAYKPRYAKAAGITRSES